MTPTLRGEIQRIARALEGRYLDQEIELRTAGGEVLLRAGGRWDRLQRRYDGPAAAPHVVTVKRSQEEAARKLAAWFVQYDADDPARVAIEMYADRRRGGKTFFVVLLVVLFLLRYPRKRDGQAQIGWLVIPRYPKAREVHETLRKILPPAWLRGPWLWRKVDKLYTLPSGAEMYVKSGDDVELLKEGGVGVIGVNEAQEVGGVGIIHCLGNNIDSGGLTGIALNPPNSALGLWAEALHEAIMAGHIRYARATSFPPEGNDAIDQGARTRFSEVAAIIDPKQEQRDAQGLWVAIHDRCYPFFAKSKHVKPRGALAGLQDITADLNALTGALMKGDLREWGVGMDFQGRPWCGAVRAKGYAALPGNALGLDPGAVVYVLHGECTNDLDLGQWWHEERLCKEMLERGWDTRSCLVIADGTGKTQGSTGRQRGREADPATFSFPLVESFGYEIHAPMERREYVRHPKRGTEIVDVARNPPVPTRLNIVNTLLDEGRLIILDSCGNDEKQPGGIVAESFRICAADANKKPKGRGAHLTDAVGYLLFRWETALREAREMRAA
jgi:hypothetical protein